MLEIQVLQEYKSCCDIGPQLCIRDVTSLGGAPNVGAGTIITGQNICSSLWQQEVKFVAKFVSLNCVHSMTCFVGTADGVGHKFMSMPCMQSLFLRHSNTSITSAATTNLAAICVAIALSSLLMFTHFWLCTLQDKLRPQIRSFDDTRSSVMISYHADIFLSQAVLHTCFIFTVAHIAWIGAHRYCSHQSRCIITH